MLTSWQLVVRHSQLALINSGQCLPAWLACVRWIWARRICWRRPWTSSDTGFWMQMMQGGCVNECGYSRFSCFSLPCAGAFLLDGHGTWPCCHCYASTGTLWSNLSCKGWAWNWKLPKRVVNQRCCRGVRGANRGETLGPAPFPRLQKEASVAAQITVR